MSAPQHPTDAPSERGLSPSLLLSLSLLFLFLGAWLIHRAPAHGRDPESPPLHSTPVPVPVDAWTGSAYSNH